MKQYDNYKNIGVEWIGEIPENWKISKAKFTSIFRMGQTILKEDLVDNGKYPVYSATEGDHFFGYINNPNFILEKGDIVIPARGNSIGYVVLVNEQCVSTQTTIASKVNTKIIYPNYLFYYYKGFKTILFHFDQTAIPQITVNQVENNIVIIPTYEEQIKIATFLDYKTNLIDSTIEKKKKLIELLKEKRQAVINKAVTKGLNLNVPMKVSGVEWLGEIPVHWKTSKLKWISHIYSGGTPNTNIDKYWVDGNIPWLNSGTVNQKRIKVASNFITEEALLNSSTKWVPKNSILMALAGQGKTKGTVGILEIEATCNQSMAAIVADKSEVNHEFLFYWLHSNYNRIRGLASSDQRDGLNLEMVGNIFCPLPNKEEQLFIANYLNHFESKHDSIINKLETAIVKLQEYRQSFISEAVTGKIDLRDWSN